MPDSNVIQQSTNYDQFKLLTANREQNRGHIEAVKRAFEAIGNLTPTQPILVNEHYEIIDGQHRFIACKELSVPVFFMVKSGLTVHDARGMNLLHRPWTVDDYATSYASTNNPNYIKYLELRELYGLTHSATLMYITGGNDKGIYKNFREGTMVIDDYDAVLARFELLKDVSEHVEDASHKPFQQAFLRIMSIPEFDVERFKRKLDEVANLYVKHFASPQEYLRAFEEVYNFRYSDANRLRLY